MATYYPSSSAQTDVFSAPYGNMMMYLNPASSTGSFSEISPGSSMNPQNRMEIPSMGARNEMMFIPPTGGDPMSMQTLSGHLNTGATDTISSSIPREQNLQGLSLSLSTQMSTPSFQFQYSNPGLSSVLSPHLPLSAENSVRQMACKVDETSPSNKDNMRSADYFSYHMQGDGSNPQYPMIMKTMNCNPYHYEQTGVAGNVLKSKYLKAAQELLDEVVNVRDALKKTQSEKEQSLNKMDEGSKESRGGSQPVSETNESAPGSGPSQELSPAERQELQSKLDKLHSMLDEVDRRYKQYCHQMQLLASSFDVVAGNGAAKPYTALALKTISRHFRCLRDAITNQIQSTRKSLGEQDNGLGVIPRLRYVDQQLRQQRALQQFGMMRHSWRPQRGLPENAVTILRAWLFEHFLHPYPKDSEKIMLARQTGLTRSQVANWFINARVRLWKPMIEEMYKEEFVEDVDINSKSSQENTPTPKLARYKSWGSEERREEMLETTTTSMTHEPHDSKTGPNPGLDIKGLTSSTPGLHIGSLGNNDNNPGYCTHGSIPADPNATGHLMVNTYQMPELGNFGVGNNQVSLALGLRHCEGDAMPMTSTAGETTMGVGVGNSEYPYLEQVNQQHRFGNPHILNDFVA